MKLSKKTKFNIKALGLSLYIYVLSWFILTIPLAWFFGESSTELVNNNLRGMYVFATKGVPLYIPIQFLLFLFSKYLLKKNSSQSIREFIYISFSIVAVLLILFTVFPPDGLRLIG